MFVLLPWYRLRQLIAALGLVATFAAAAQPASPRQPGRHAHVHGAATLNIAIQELAVTITLEAPLESLVGFERRPKTPAQTAALDAMQAKLRSPQGLFAFDASAGCSLSRSEVGPPQFAAAAAGGKASEHADIDASFEFRCTAPGRLAVLDVGLFDAFANLNVLKVVVAAPGGQLKRDLRRPARQVALRR